MNKRVLIIGGGASGMMAALSAAEHGASAVIVEHGNKLCRKLLATGNGRCNFTNAVQKPECYHSGDPSFPWKIISNFTEADTVSFFLQLGIYSHNRNGFLYPNSDQASSVADSFRYALENKRVKLHLNSEPSSIKVLPDGFEVITDSGYAYDCDSLIIASGSPAGNIVGADESGFHLAKMLGHSIVPLRPALVQLATDSPFIGGLAGIRIDALISLVSNGELLRSERGEVQFTERFVSGIPTFQLSGSFSDALAEGQSVSAVLDFMPDFSYDLLVLFLEKRVQACGYRLNRDFLTGLFPAALSRSLSKASSLDPLHPASFLNANEISALAYKIKNFEIRITGTNSMKEAQVARGGIDTTDIDSSSMESKIIKGLFFAGEIVDVDGICGGYNLQWAWSSGYIAGKYAAKHAGKELTEG